MGGDETNEDDSQRIQPIGTPISAFDALYNAGMEREREILRLREEQREADLTDPLPIPDFRFTEQAEFDASLAPRDALVRFRYAVPVAITQLFRELQFARIVAIADQAIVTRDGQTSIFHLVVVPTWVWSRELGEQEDFWDTGYLERGLPNRGLDINANRWIRLFDIRFWPEGLPGGADSVSDATKPEVNEPSMGKPKGGRPSGKHGEPIARITMRMLSLPPQELASFTAASLAQELIAEFKRLNLVPPSLDNAERDAAGILRAVRN